jgi:hypothetical protein
MDMGVVFMEELLQQGGGLLILIVGVLFALIFISIILSISNRSSMQAAQEYYFALAEYLGNGEARDILHDLAELVRNLEHEGKQREKDIADVYEALSGCIQKVAIVRYNAFRNMGSDLSFSVALLDSEDNGIVLSSLHGRDMSSTYAKPVRAGSSKYILTDEEETAISNARRSHLGKSYYGAGGRRAE